MAAPAAEMSTDSSLSEGLSLISQNNNNDSVNDNPSSSPYQVATSSALSALSCADDMDEFEFLVKMNEKAAAAAAAQQRLNAAATAAAISSQENGSSLAPLNTSFGGMHFGNDPSSSSAGINNKTFSTVPPPGYICKLW